MDWVGFFSGMSPQLQGIVVFGVAIGVGVFLGRRYLKRLVMDRPASRVFAAGEPTAFADMAPVHDLVKNVEMLTLQAMKSGVEVSSLIAAFKESTATIAASLDRLVDIAGQLMMDLREQREAEATEALRLKYIEEGKELARDEAKNKRRAKTRPSRARIQSPKEQ